MLAGPLDELADRRLKGRWELSALLAADPSFAAAVVPQDTVSVAALADSFADDLRSLGLPEVVVVAVARAEDVVDATKRPGTVVLHGFGGFGPRDWDQLNLRRSRLRPADRVLLVLREEELRQLTRFAPDLASWLGTAVHRVQDDDAISPDARDERLDALRGHYGWTDDEAIARVERGDPIAREADFGEWMVLLGRPELLRPDA